MDEVTKLKAEIFDLQVEFGRIRQLITSKIEELNKLNGQHTKRVLPADAGKE